MKKIIRSAWEEDMRQYREDMVNEGIYDAWEAAFLNGADDSYMDWDPEV